MNHQLVTFCHGHAALASVFYHQVCIHYVLKTLLQESRFKMSQLQINMKKEKSQQERQKQHFQPTHRANISLIS